MSEEKFLSSSEVIVVYDYESRPQAFFPKSEVMGVYWNSEEYVLVVMLKNGTAASLGVSNYSEQIERIMGDLGYN